MPASAQFDARFSLEDIALCIDKVHIPRDPDRAGPRVDEDLWIIAHYLLTLNRGNRGALGYVMGGAAST